MAAARKVEKVFSTEMTRSSAVVARKIEFLYVQKVCRALIHTYVGRIRRHPFLMVGNRVENRVLCCILYCYD